MDYYCNSKKNRFYQDLTCHRPDPLIDDVKDMWNYRNSHRGALDQIPANDQEDSAADNWYEQNRNYEIDVNLNEPQLNGAAAYEVSKSFMDFLGVDEDGDHITESEPKRNVEFPLNENASQFEMFADSLYLSIADSFESKPSMFRSTKRIAMRIDEEEFSKLVDRKIKDDTLAASFKAIHHLLITEE